MNITFDLQELAQLLSKALGCTVATQNIHFTNDECVTLTEVSVETITKAAQATQTTSAPPVTLFTPPYPVTRISQNLLEEEPKPEASDNFDDVLKVSQQLAQIVPDESQEFPADFMKQVLEKIR